MEDLKKTRKEEDKRKEESAYGTVNKDTKIEVKSAEDPHAGEDSGIPGTGSGGNIGNAQSGAGVGGNKGKGTSDYPNKR